VNVESASRTDVGRVRSRNEDQLVCVPDLKLFIVADGMGGHQGGDVASRFACAAIEEHIRGKWFIVDGYEHEPLPSRRRQVMQLLTEAVRSANDRIVLESEQTPELDGMGSTVVVMLMVADRAFVAHVGDSRAYLLRDGIATLLTEDHSLLFELLRQGRLNRAQAARFPMKNVVTRALGVRGPVEADILELQVLPGDRFVLCSDGLHGYVEDERLPRLVGDSPLQAVADRLVAFANAGGGSDNISAVVVEVKSISVEPVIAKAEFQTMRGMALFQGLSLSEILHLVSNAEHRRIGQGDSLIRHGDRPEGLFILLRGALELRRGAALTQRIEAGSSYGDISLLEDRPSDDSIVATEVSDVAVVTRRSFEMLCGAAPQTAVRLLRQMSRSLARRLKIANDEAGIMRSMLERESVITPLFRTTDVMFTDDAPADDGLTPTEGLRLMREDSDEKPD
jgi:serine/threonine protein phosphatase PrpC/CRP-like cAMP-binding protein